MLSPGTVVAAEDKTRKPKTAYEHIMADDDGLIHDGKNFTVSEVLNSDEADLCDLYLCEPAGILKLARRISDNDLVENEARVLRHLNGTTRKGGTFDHYIPRLLHALNHEGHAGNILSLVSGFITLGTVRRGYPAGIDFRDMVWMYKRLLVGIGYAHEQGVVHGAILPPHVLVHPTDHGAVIVDWSYAITDPKDRIKALSLPFESFYPPEVTRRESPTPATDIFMAAKCALFLLGADPATDKIPDSVPQPIQDFFLPSLDERAKHRPQNAWDLHTEFDKLLETVVGKPKYRPFKLPEPK